MDQTKVLKELMKNKNYDEILERVAQEIEQQETDLKMQITQNHSEIIKNCASISEFKCQTGLEAVTQQLNDFAVSICLNQRELQENDEVAEKCNEIHTFLVNLQHILDSYDSNNDNIYNLQNYNEMHRRVKVFKKCVFYDKLKQLVNNKKTSIFENSKQQSSIWLGEILKLYGDFGNRIIKNEEINRNEFFLTEVLSCLYIYRKLDSEDEFYEFFNSKRIKIGSHLKIHEMLGFLYVEKELFNIDKHFKINKYNVNFDKEELIILIKYMNMFDIDSKDADQKLEKICCDFIIDNRENINSKADVDLFIHKGQDFLVNVNNPAVIEFYYKVVDDSILKYYGDSEIENKIKQVHQYKNTDYKFKSYDKIKEMKEDEMRKVDRIFADENYDELKSIGIDNEIVNYIKGKFDKKLSDSDKKKKIMVDGEIVKYYVHLKGHNNETAENFYKGLKADN